MLMVSGDAALAEVLDAPNSPWDLDVGRRAAVFRDVYMSVSA
jgi:hypothetical protein